MNGIPHPPRYPVIGNLALIKGKPFVQTVRKLGDMYGPLFEIRLPGSRFFVASSFEMADELCDEKRFHKVVGGPLKELRRLIGNGLFTADSNDPDWETSHNLIMPAFSMKAIRQYFPKMQEIAEQMIASWKKQGVVQVTDDCTRMTLDTIALTGFNYRFDSFQNEKLHPFVDAMNRSLVYSLTRVQKTRLQNWLAKSAEAEFQRDRQLMFSTVDDLIEKRLKNPAELPDMLGMMLDGVDKKSGRNLNRDLIRYQLITFLIAGHETTSGLLSFTLYYLMKNPDIFARAQAEVDAIWKDDPDKALEFSDVTGLKYVTQLLKESLRLWPTAPGFSRTPYEPTVLGGRFALRPGDRVLISLSCLHRDPKIWGEDFETYDPERFSPENSRKRPERAFKPFGTGARMCIGQNFAMVEAALTIALLLRHFHFEDIDCYQLEVQETLTLKPRNFRMRVHPRIPKG